MGDAARAVGDHGDSWLNQKRDDDPLPAPHEEVMSLFSALSESIRVTTDLARSSVDRIRLEAKLKSLERRQTQALAALGRRVRELSLSGELTDDRLTEEIAEVAAAEMRIAACEAEIDEVSASSSPSSTTSESVDHSPTPEESEDDDDDDAAKAVAEAEAAAGSQMETASADEQTSGGSETTDGDAAA